MCGTGPADSTSCRNPCSSGRTVTSAAGSGGAGRGAVFCPRYFEIDSPGKTMAPGENCEGSMVYSVDGLAAETCRRLVSARGAGLFSRGYYLELDPRGST